MRKSSYCELASFFPDDLLLAGGALTKSESFEWLSLAASKIVHPPGVQLSRFVPFGGEYRSISTDDKRELVGIVKLNEDALSQIRIAVNHKDFRVLAVPRYYIKRVTVDLDELIRKISYLQDLLCAKARLHIHEHQTNLACDTISTLLTLSDMLCTGGGDFDFYMQGHFGRMRSLWATHECLLSSHFSTKELRYLFDVLQSSICKIEGYLQSQLSDYFRDVIVSIVEAQKRESTVDELIDAIAATLVRSQLIHGNSNDELNAPREDLKTKIDAISRAITSNASPFDAEHTMRELARVYMIYRDSFAARFDSRMPEIELQPDFNVIWPEEFQLTSGSNRATASNFVEQILDRISATRNALGNLVIRDIIRVADGLVQGELIHPWRMRLEMTATALLCKACEFQLRFGRRANSMEELHSVTTSPIVPRDPLSGSPLSISDDKEAIMGPSLDKVYARIPISMEEAALRWAIPNLGMRNS